MKEWELQTIAMRACLPLRTLRYVLDHRLLPGARVMQAEHAAGRPRYLTGHEAFGLACAALLLQGGLKRQTVVSFMDGLCQLTWSGRQRRRGNAGEQPALITALTSKNEAASARFGDSVNLRIQVGSRDTGWVQPKTWAKLSDDYAPRIVVDLDLGQLRDLLLDRTLG
jgi:hypothetical protein